MKHRKFFHSHSGKDRKQHKQCYAPHHGSWCAKLRAQEERQVHTESTAHKHHGIGILHTQNSMLTYIYKNPDVTASNACVLGITLEAQTRDRSETTNKIKRFSPVYS